MGSRYFIKHPGETQRRREERTGCETSHSPLPPKAGRGSRRGISQSCSSPSVSPFSLARARSKGEDQTASASPRLRGIRSKRMAGFSLIELIVTIVILTVAVGTIVSVYSFVTARSADPMIRSQLIAVSEAFMDEITSKEIDPETPITDPRSQRNVIDPYDGETYEPPTDATGEPMAGLDDYRVEISAEDDAFGLGDDSREIEVCAEHGGERVCITGFRTNF